MGSPHLFWLPTHEGVWVTIPCTTISVSPAMIVTHSVTEIVSISLMRFCCGGGLVEVEVAMEMNFSIPTKHQHPNPTSNASAIR